MKMAKLRRKCAHLERELADRDRRLGEAREAWPALVSEKNAALVEVKDGRLANVRARRTDLARIANLHQKVLRRIPGKGRAEAFFCEECNVRYPCRTIDVLARLGEQLDARFAELRAS